MDLNKVCIGIIVLVAFLGVACGNISNNVVYGAETWIDPTASSVYMNNLYATIHVHIKNNENHVEYFKISQVYTSKLDSPILWNITSKPGAVKMVDTVSPELGGDWGWKINPGETKEVTFTLLAVDNSTNPLVFIIGNKGAVANTYWPLIPDPGVFSSWFQPNEIEILNPNLDLKYWRGSFSFNLRSVDSQSVSGIIRAPIVPTDSKLTDSDPQVTFADKDLVLNGAVAAWDVTLGAGASKRYEYTYVWPSGASSSSTGAFSSSIPTTSAASKTSSVPTKETGIPYGLFVVGGILTAGGLIYARFMR